MNSQPTPELAAKSSPYNHWHCAGPCFTCTGPCTCNRACSGLPLSLADKQLITDRIALTGIDPETGREYCADCLEDLHPDPYWALFHVCGQPDPGPVMRQRAHKTAATRPTGLVLTHGDGTVRLDAWLRPVRDMSSAASCTCGWKRTAPTRAKARRLARQHRDHAKPYWTKTPEPGKGNT